MRADTPATGRSWGIALPVTAAIAISYLDRQTLPWVIGHMRKDSPISNQTKALRDSVPLDALAEEAARYKAQGVGAMKLRFGWRPDDGAAGMARTVELVRTVREAEDIAAVVEPLRTQHS